MKRALVLSMLGILTSGAIPQQAIADEVWQTKTPRFGEVVYEEERGTTAIWSYGNSQGKLFIEGLAGQYDHRGSYVGYWAQDSYSSPVSCDTFREGIDGLPTYQWGKVELTFLDADFPARWIMTVGECEASPSTTINGTPMN